MADQRFRRDLRDLVGLRDDSGQVLPAVPVKPPINSGPGIAESPPKKEEPAPAIGGGIASPLTEPDASARTYHSSSALMTSSDGLIVIQYDPVESVTMQDDNEEEVVLNFDDPTA